MPTGSKEHRDDLSALRREITELVARNAVVMVQNAIDAVNEAGQYQAIKYLFEMIGLYPALGTEDDTPEASLAGALLRHLGVREAPAEHGSRHGDGSQPLDPIQ
jgi:hypothetical protein